MHHARVPNDIAAIKREIKKTSRKKALVTKAQSRVDAFTLPDSLVGASHILKLCRSFRYETGEVCKLAWDENLERKKNNFSEPDWSAPWKKCTIFLLQVIISFLKCSFTVKIKQKKSAKTCAQTDENFCNLKLTCVEDSFGRIHPNNIQRSSASGWRSINLPLHSRTIARPWRSLKMEVMAVKFCTTRLWG